MTKYITDELKKQAQEEIADEGKAKAIMCYKTLLAEKEKQWYSVANVRKKLQRLLRKLKKIAYIQHY